MTSTSKRSLIKLAGWSSLAVAAALVGCGKKEQAPAAAAPAASPAAAQVAAVTETGSAASGAAGISAESVARTAVPVTAAGLALTGALLFVRRRRANAVARTTSAGLPA